MADDPLLTFDTSLRKLILIFVSMIASLAVAAGDPALPGHHPLSQAQAGNLLMSELRCAACHTGVEQGFIPEKTAPDLAEVGTRVSPEYLQRFLESPLTAHLGTTMPDLLGSRPESERKNIAESLTHFLIAQSKASAPSEPMGRIDRQQGKLLYHTVGCVACHGPREPPDATPPSRHPIDLEEEESDPVLAAKKRIKPIAVSLEHVSKKYRVASLSDFLFQPLRVRSSGRMPDMKLTPAESLAIADYLIGDIPPPAKTSWVPDAAFVEEGRKHFQALNCASCHALAGMPAAPKVGSLKNADTSRGCLSKWTEPVLNRHVPRFELDEPQRAALLAAIRTEPTSDSDSDTLAKTLTVFRCVACHVRDNYGGVHEAHNPFFKGSELNLGDDGRIPPPLTLMGAKLRPTWMKKVLFDGESVRQYMATRMPLYGTGNLQHLPEIFGRLDKLIGPEMAIPSPESRNEDERQREKLLRAAGRELLGDKGANCVACHQFNGKAANVNKGIDLLTSYERLQPAWFHSYVQKPGAFRPRTVMPSAWPDGVSAFKSILDGDTDRQIEAIWYYLSLGTSAADPPGVRSISTKLEVGEHAVIHRGRSRVAGFRGIAVGLPEKLSYAFNAETGTLSAIWQGDFIGVNWSGQGSGDFNPVGEAITLPQDVSFATLADASHSWPLMPVMTKESPVNPNPLYPKNVGYQFRGYFLDEFSIPTFQYRSGNVEIADRSFAMVRDEHKALQRVMQFESPASQTLWFRALVGDIRRESDHVFRSGRLRLTVRATDTPATETHLRSSPDQPERQELLLQLHIPQGKSSLELHYEPLNK